MNNYMGEDFDDVSIELIRNEIIKFKNDPISQQLDTYYNTKTYSEILGVSRRELSHSSFLAWLFNNVESHNLASYPILKFFEILVISSNSQQAKENKELFDSIITGTVLIDQLDVQTEKSIQGVGRIDIYIEAELSYVNKKEKLMRTKKE